MKLKHCCKRITAEAKGIQNTVDNDKFCIVQEILQCSMVLKINNDKLYVMTSGGMARMGGYVEGWVLSRGMGCKIEGWLGK